MALLQVCYFERVGKAFIYPFNDTYHFILNLFFISGWGLEKGGAFNAPVWSVSIEVFLYGVFFLLAFFGSAKWFFCLGLSIVSFLLLPNHHYAILNGLALFFLGGVVFDLSWLISNKYTFLKKGVYLGAFFAWAFTIITIYFSQSIRLLPDLGPRSDFYIYTFACYILFPFTVASLALAQTQKSLSFLKCFSWLGSISYSSYLLHFPLQLLFALALSYGFLPSDFYLKAFYLNLFFFLLIPLSYLVYIFFEKPVQIFLRRKLGVGLKK